MNIGDLMSEVHETAIEKGWWDNPRPFPESIALLHTEATEAFEEYRDGHVLTEIYFHKDVDGNDKPEGVPVELADLVIRVLDICEGYGIPLELGLQLKVGYNKTRPHRHGGKLA